MRAFTNSLRRRLPYLFLALLVAVSLIVLPGMKTLPTVKALEKIPASGKTPFALNMPLGAGSLTLFMPLVGRNPFVFEDNFLTNKGWPDGVALCEDDGDYDTCSHGDGDEVCYFDYDSVNHYYVIKGYKENVICAAENPNINLANGTYIVKLQRTSDAEAPAHMGFFFGAGDFDDENNEVENRWEYLAYPNETSDEDDCDEGGFWVRAYEDGDFKDGAFDCNDRIREDQNDLMTLTATRNGEDLHVYASRTGQNTKEGDLDDLDDTDYNLSKGRFYLAIMPTDYDDDVDWDDDPLTVKFTYVGIRNDFVVPTP